MTDRIKAAQGRTADCPSLEALAESSRNPDLKRHVETCGYCRTELALLHAFENDQPQPEELASVQWIERELRRGPVAATLTVPAPSTWRRLLAWLGAAFGPGRQPAFAMVAASLVMAAAAGLYLRQPGTLRPPAATGGVVFRSGQFAAVSPSGEVAEAPAEFRWEAVAGAASYRVQLMQVDRTVIWTSESTQTTVEIPNDIRAQLRSGRAFQWQVGARNAAGEVIANTDLQIFHIVVTIP